MYKMTKGYRKSKRRIRRKNNKTRRMRVIKGGGGWPKYDNLIALRTNDPSEFDKVSETDRNKLVRYENMVNEGYDFKVSGRTIMYKKPNSVVFEKIPTDLFSL